MIRSNTIDIHGSLADAMELVQRGETVSVTDAGRVVAQIVPAERIARSPEQLEATRSFLEEFGRTHSRGDMSVREMRDQGRP